MARPRGYEVEEVLQNAMTVFWRQGYALASMADLYAATGLKPGNLYATFHDKGALFRRAFETYARHFRATLPEGLEGRAAIEAWLRVQARLAVEDPERKGCLIVNTAAERGAHDPETRAMAAERMAEITGYFRAHLGIAVARGEVAAATDIEQVAAALTGAVVAIMTMARGGAEAATIHAIADHAIASL